MATDFQLYQGDSKTLSVTVKDATGAVVVITGASIKWQASKSKGKTSDISKTTSSGISITNGAGGVFQVTIAASDTESLVGEFYHEAEVIFSDSTVSTVLVGRMRVIPVLIAAT